MNVDMSTINELKFHVYKRIAIENWNILSNTKMPKNKFDRL